MVTDNGIEQRLLPQKCLLHSLPSSSLKGKMEIRWSIIWCPLVPRRDSYLCCFLDDTCTSKGSANKIAIGILAFWNGFCICYLEFKHESSSEVRKMWGCLKCKYIDCIFFADALTLGRPTRKKSWSMTVAFAQLTYDLLCSIFFFRNFPKRNLS